MKRSIVFVIVILAFGHVVRAGPVNLNSWSELTLNFLDGHSFISPSAPIILTPLLPVE